MRTGESADNVTTQNTTNEATDDGCIGFAARWSQDRDSLPKRDFLDIMQDSPRNSRAARRIERQPGSCPETAGPRAFKLVTRGIVHHESPPCRICPPGRDHRAAVVARADAIEIKPGDHIALIGNTLADRMQHDGWLETYLQARFPDHKLVIRNLGFSGDELTLRLRSANFGTPDQWLTKTKADVVFAFFGYNESFAGKAGLPAFRRDLGAFVKHTLAQKYNGKSAPRLVLFSPIAMEAPRGRDLPDPSATNERLKLYSAAMAEMAKADGVAFVDLFAPTLSCTKRPPSRSRSTAFT